jgi:hypothetical protein
MRPIHWLMLLPAALPAALLGACATHAVDKNYGSAYEQMLREQTYNPATRGTAPGDKAVEGIDPALADAALEAMRKDTADRTAVKPAPVISITQQSGGGGGSQ